MSRYYDDFETRSADQRAADMARDLPAQIANAMEIAPAMAKHLAGVDAAAVTDRAALAKLPVLRKSELVAAQAAEPPF
ncbi:MAG: phenylacetate--CoA ligase family protein, partial [Pseudomonadota bacterium]